MTVKLYNKKLLLIHCTLLPYLFNHLFLIYQIFYEKKSNLSKVFYCMSNEEYITPTKCERNISYKN